MVSYWFRHRFFFTVLFTAAVALIAVILFVFPFISNRANSYNEQSVYKNSSVDFIAPEPSFEQIKELPGSNGIDKVFPFYMTKTSVEINGSSRTTTILLSDQFENTDITMYNDKRLIEKSSQDYDNPVFVDWQFCYDTKAKLGDKVMIPLNGQPVEFRISAIYETNSIYDGGAILVRINEQQSQTIKENSNGNGYSAMYIAASNYEMCRTYLITDYRPLGRLKSRYQFKDDDQYQVHYNAIMSSGYGNEITDFKVKESNAKEVGSYLLWIGLALTVVLTFAFNVILSRRGCEKGYFVKYCIPKGLKVSSYYSTAFFCEMILFVLFYVGALVFRVLKASIYIPKAVYGIELLFIPIGVLVVELICLIMNNLSIKAKNGGKH